MPEVLKSLIQFDNVPGLGVESKPHGLNLGGIHGGRKEIPDHLEVNNGAFSVTADDTNVTVTNTSADPQSVGVLAEMWHSVVREFGASQGKDVKDSLPVRPYVPASGGGSGGPDEKVKASENDTTPGYLDQKLLAGSGVALVIVNPGDDEDVEISVSGADADDIVTGAPITVRGAVNAEGVGDPIARADHDHRLELEVEDEGALAGARPAINFIGVGVGAVDNPGQDRVDITIPGTPSDGTVVKRSVALEDTVSTSSPSFVDGMSATPVVVPMDGEYWAIWEGECRQSSANAILEVGISVNSVVAVTPNSERRIQSDAADLGNFVTTIQLGALVAGDLVRGLFRRSSGTGPQSVTIEYRHLSIFKVQ